MKYTLSNKTLSKWKDFNGYFLPNNTLVISIIGIFSALILVLTMIIPIRIPATQGYINIGDIGVIITGLLFGPVIGGISGGVGSALADIILAPQYALPTLVIKGLEGFVVGLISNPRKFYKKFDYRDFTGILIGGLIMVFGYFIIEIIFYGFPSALFEFFLNVFIQFGLGAVAGILFSIFVRKNIIDNLPQVFEKIFLNQNQENKKRDY